MNKHSSKQLRIILAGGSTAGPILPLLALRQEIMRQDPHAYFLVVDVKGSVGQHAAVHEKIRFFPIITGKLRRYLSLRTVIAPFLVLIGFFQSLYLLSRYRITHVIGAGGFVQVPLVWTAWLLRRRVHIHQQDIVPTLANVVSAPFAKSISVTFASSQRDFPQGSGLFAQERKSKVHLTGNPIRPELLTASRVEAQKFFKLDKSWPTLYILGGGSGALGINKLIYEALPELTRTVQIIHSTGRGKHKEVNYERYQSHEYIVRQDLALAAADMVIGRAGVYTLTELSNLGKVGIIIPMPKSHQEVNALMLYEQRAAIILDQEATTPAYLVKVIRRLLFDLPTQKMLQENIQGIMPHQSAKAITKLVLENYES